MVAVKERIARSKGFTMQVPNEDWWCDPEYGMPMAGQRRPEYDSGHLPKVSQVQALAEAIRQKILDVVREHGPMSAREIAEHIDGQSPKQIQGRMAALRVRGLVEVAEIQTGNHNTNTWIASPPK